MDSTCLPTILLRETDTFKDEIEEIYDRITKRAYEMFLEHGTLDIDSWLAAERELVIKPEVDLTHDHEKFTAKVNLSSLAVYDAELLMTCADLLFRAQTDRWPVSIFRTIRLPRPINRRSVEARIVENSVLIQGKFAD